MEFDAFMRSLSGRCQAANVPAVSPETGDFLAALARRHGSRRILEIGTAHGYSTLRLADAMGEEGRVITLEFSAPSYEAACGYFAESGIGHRIEPIFGNALAIIADLPLDELFDAAFVDGEKKRTVEFLSAVWPLVRPGGWIAVDDAIKFRWKME
jgi:predicted O-methyltransferase YrrM